MIDYSATQTLIESMVSERVVPGVNYAFINNEQIFTSTIGFASIYPTVTQLSPFAEYDLASLTKVLITENILLKLYQENELNFSEPLHQFIPEFTDERVRLFHLMTHTSGIRGWIEHRDELSHDKLLDAIIHLPVTNEFEHKMRYADTNFILLGLVIKKIFGKPVQEVGQTELIDVMKLANTTFHPTKSACVPTALFNGKVLQGIPHDPKAQQLGSDCGSAGLFSTLHTCFTGVLILLDRVRKSGLILLTNRVHPTGHNQIFLPNLVKNNAITCH
ncbi:serine hydrolase [Lactobacillus sp. ESL0228]|uniref:serine hydrolase domain-containing protein n=1 Tax=Lactobacillus sp. ESL0228 TaxID=2069352 RepID=UPI000EFD271B|nr:serine hydrolase domain-containing protein [Lactobacillus sp. ESL0228]RMC49744.1 class A beta-lactamase-related serine hydrolase [Lactobacillus sp. ESL0228]